MLALVLVDALALRIEQRRGIEYQAVCGAQPVRQLGLVRAFDRAPLLLEAGVACEPLELAQAIEVA
jgi:hypothetical protein